MFEEALMRHIEEGNPTLASWCLPFVDPAYRDAGGYNFLHQAINRLVRMPKLMFLTGNLKTFFAREDDMSSEDRQYIKATQLAEVYDRLTILQDIVAKVTKKADWHKLALETIQLTDGPTGDTITFSTLGLLLSNTRNPLLYDYKFTDICVKLCKLPSIGASNLVGALSWAIAASNYASDNRAYHNIFKALVDAGADVTETSDGRNVLHSAFRSIHSEYILAVLFSQVQYHPDVLQALDPSGQSLWDIAASRNSEPQFTVLRKYAPTVPDTFIYRALCSALAFHQYRGKSNYISTSILKRLASMHPDMSPNQLNKEGLAPLHMAVVHMTREQMPVVIGQDHFMNQFMEERVHRKQKVRWIRFSNRFSGIHSLLAMGAAIDYPDANGNTALHLAAVNTDKDLPEVCTQVGDATTYTVSATNMLLYLLTRGADWRLKNKDGLTALDLVKQQGNAVAISLLTLWDEIHAQDLTQPISSSMTTTNTQHAEISGHGLTETMLHAFIQQQFKQLAELFNLYDRDTTPFRTYTTDVSSMTAKEKLRYEKHPEVQADLKAGFVAILQPLREICKGLTIYGVKPLPTGPMRDVLICLPLHVEQMQSKYNEISTRNEPLASLTSRLGYSRLHLATSLLRISTTLHHALTEAAAKSSLTPLRPVRLPTTANSSLYSCSTVQVIGSSHDSAPYSTEVNLPLDTQAITPMVVVEDERYIEFTSGGYHEAGAPFYPHGSDFYEAADLELGEGPALSQSSTASSLQFTLFKPYESILPQIQSATSNPASSNNASDVGVELPHLEDTEETGALSRHVSTPDPEPGLSHQEGISESIADEVVLILPDALPSVPADQIPAPTAIDESARIANAALIAAGLHLPAVPSRQMPSENILTLPL